MWCADCESIDEYFFDLTNFWIFVPTVETFGKVAVYCGSSGFAAVQKNSHCINVDVGKADLDRFLTGLYGALESMELEGTKITSTPEGEPDLEAMGRIVPLSVLINRYKSKWVTDALEHKTYESWYQPIIHTASDPENPEVFAHEALFRMSDEFGNVVPPGLVFQIAEDSDLLFSLDLTARRSAVESASKGNLKGKIFINFNPSSIYDPSYCLRTTASAIAELGMKPKDVVFEITETHRASDLNHLKGILSFYRNAGFGIALDDIGSGWSGLNLLHEVRPDYVKLDMELIRDIHQHDFKQAIVTHLIEMARSSDIRVIAEGVEVQEEYDWIKSTGVDYIQGYYFAKPSKVNELPEYSMSKRKKVA